MAKLFNLARMTTATTGTGTITLGSAVAGFLSFASAGVANADVVAYGIQDGANSEVGTGTYTSSGTTLSRTVLASTNAGSAISLSGNAQVFITALKEHIGNLTEDNTWTGIQNFSAKVRPTSDDGAPLGDTTHNFSDIFLASGAVVNFANSDVTITHSTDKLTLAGGNLTLAAGTTSVAPLTFQSGTNLTTTVDGSAEYDGVVFYGTIPTTKRGVSPALHFLTLSANQSGSNSSSAQTWFPGGGSTSLTVAASTTYAFEGMFASARTAGTTSHSISFLFGGTATVTSIAYILEGVQSLGGFFGAASATMALVQVATSTGLWTATTSANEHVIIRMRGIVRINASGTFIPQFLYNAAPGGTPTIQANTYFKMWALGASSVLNVGNWS